MATVDVEISTSGKRIRVDFDYDKRLVELMKSISGSRFTGKDAGGPFWTCPLDIPTCRDLRDRFKKGLHIGPQLAAWALTHIREQERIIAISHAADWELDRVPHVLPDLAKVVRHYQRVGIAFVAQCPHPLLADDTRLGKCMQTIGGIHEAGLENGAHLVVAPSTSLETTWEKELWKWQDFPSWIVQGTKLQRQRIIDDFHAHVDSGEPGWLVVNPKMLAYRSAFDTCDDHFADEKVGVLRKCEWCDEYQVSEYPMLHTYDFNTITIDECSRDGVRNPSTSTAQGMYAVHAKKRIALSATPIGGKAINLWGILHFLDPVQYSSKWNWAGRYLEIDEDEYGKSIGALKDGTEDELFRSLAHIMIHRTKVDVRPELPTEDVATDKVVLYGDHKGQYDTFAADAEIRIDEEKLTATSILAEYTRLKQFASFPHKLKGGILLPQPAGAKYDRILELLDERGILDGADRSVVIFSQFSRVVDMLAEALDKKIAVAKITGDTNRRGARKSRQDAFQQGRFKVLCMTTTAGGVAITLDRADTGIFVDQTWDPDDTYQARSRYSPVTYMTPKSTLILESNGTIEQYIAATNIEKEGVNAAMLKGIRLK